MSSPPLGIPDGTPIECVACYEPHAKAKHPRSHAAKPGFARTLRMHGPPYADEITSTFVAQPYAIITNMGALVAAIGGPNA